MRKEAPGPVVEEAETLALTGLAFLAEEPPRLDRFLALTGIAPDALEAAAAAPETLLAVLDHLLADESLLLVFAASKGIPPEQIGPARTVLAAAHGLEGGRD